MVNLKMTSSGFMDLHPDDRSSSVWQRTTHAEDDDGAGKKPETKVVRVKPFSHSRRKILRASGERDKFGKRSRFGTDKDNMWNRLGLVWLLFFTQDAAAFMIPGSHLHSPLIREGNPARPKTTLQMGLDMVTYMRVEWIAAALCTNQTPRSADVCLQLGCEDGRAVTFVPRTIERLITSSIEPDGVIPVSVERQLKQQEKVRNAGRVEIVNQRADDLKETPDESVDVVISLAACERMIEKGLDWKKSVQEAARVLKPGGRLLFVEPPELDGVSYLDYLANLSVQNMSGDGEEGNGELFNVFEPLGYDDVDLVLKPHVAGVVVKAEDAGLTKEERERKAKNAEQERYAEISISAFERGLKKRKRKKKNADGAESTA